MKDAETSDEAEFERLLEECIERFESEGAAGVADVCERRPELAARLRERLASLQRLGLLGGEREGARPDTIGRYEILRPLGRGGMAVVYLARDPRDGKLVALKSAATPLSGDRHAHARFEREIQAIEGLRHPGVVTVLDSGEEHGRPFFTMEYVEGPTLAEVVRGLRDSGRDLDAISGADVGALVSGPEQAAGGTWARSYFETATRIVLQVAEALEHLHARGVLHRDVKPSNILLRGDGRALLFDLGLAHVDDQPALTHSKDFAGTPYYVSPEQVSGGPKGLDARSDVYSLGVTLFELLTLCRPFEGRTTAQVLRSIAIDEPPLPRRLNPLVPRGLETICLAALEKDPERRYGSARELADDLERFLAFKPVRARPVGALTRGTRFVRRHPAQAAAVLLIALLAIGLPLGLALANRAIRAQRDLAAESAAEARRQVARNARQVDFLVELFESTGASAEAGEPLHARDVLDRSAQRIDVQFEGEPLARAALLEATGRVYANLGMHARAIHQLDRSFAILSRELGGRHVDVAGVLLALSEVHLASGNAADSEALARRALEAFEGSDAGAGRAELRCRLTLADALVALDRGDEARGVLEAGLAARPDLSDAGEERAAFEERLARLAEERGALDEARRRLEAALLLREAEPDPDLGALVTTLDALAGILRRDGQEAPAAVFADRAAELRLAWASEALGSAEPGTPVVMEELLSRFLLLPAWTADYERAFQRGITALQSGRPREALPLFERCLEWEPDRSVCAYNLACSYALLGEVEPALEWFERAAELGMGAVDARWETMRRDPDLSALRGEPRYARVLEQVAAMRARVAREVATPAFRAPGGGPGPWPLLVVLHAAGQDKQAVLSGPWARAAGELGLALLVPSGPLPVGADPALGMQWFEDVRDLVRRPGSHAARIVGLVEACGEQYPIDPERVFLAGEGSAAPLAFDLAMRAPGLFQGVLLWDGTLLPEVEGDRARRAAALGMRVHLVIEDRTRLPAQPSPEELERHAAEAGRWLAARGLSSRVALPVGPAAGHTRIAEELTLLVQPAD